MAATWISAAAANGQPLTLRRNGTNLQLVRNGVVIDSRPLATVTDYVLSGDGRDDVLTLDFGFGGFFTVGGAIRFDGGGGTDRVFVTRGTLTMRFGDEIVAVRIHVNEEDDDVVEEAPRLFVVAAHHLVDHLAELLRADRFGGVESAVDPDDGFAFLR